MDISKIIQQVVEAYPQIKPYLSVKALSIAEKAKRDPREPGIKKKREMDNKLKTAFMGYFERAKKKLKKELRRDYPTKSIEINADELEAELYVLILEAVLKGIELFDEETALDVDFDEPRRLAVHFARTYTYNLIKELDATTMEAVRAAISQFVSIPSMNLSQVLEMLETTFSESRAERIAITEITRAFAHGNQLAGEALQRQWPGVRVTKTWFTNNDDLVCPICGPLDGKEVEINDTFDGMGMPPAHVNCRCWTSVGTRLA